MKKEQYIFLILIWIILYLLYLIIDHKYKEYKINSHINIIQDNNTNMDTTIDSYKEKLEYISTKAYKNKILKEEQSMKNKGESVIFITNEDKYNTFSKEPEPTIPQVVVPQSKIQDGMTIFEKWIYFLFQKDIR